MNQATERRKNNRYRFTDFSELWGEEMGRGRMSWMGKGDWIILGTIFGLLAVSLGLDCTDRMPSFVPEEWFRYFFIVAGLIWLGGGVIRFLVPQWRRPMPGLFFPGYAFLTLGIILVFGLRMWPVIVVAVILFVVETIIYNHFRKKMLAKRGERE